MAEQGPLGYLGVNIFSHNPGEQTAAPGIPTPCKEAPNNTHVVLPTLGPLYMFPELWQWAKSGPCLKELTLQLCK